MTNRKVIGSAGGASYTVGGLKVLFARVASNFGSRGWAALADRFRAFDPYRFALSIPNLLSAEEANLLIAPVQ